MSLSCSVQHFVFDSCSIQLLVPQEAAVQLAYEQAKQLNPSLPFPFWAKVWPSSLALAMYIDKNPQWVLHKKVLELASGLGLPALVAAKHASAVCCSDYIPEAVAIMQKSALLNNLINVQCNVYDWNHLPENIAANVLLLSDVNYNPESFDTMYALLLRFLSQGSTVILSTPQRLVSKAFVEKIKPYCNIHEIKEVEYDGRIVAISIFILEAQINQTN